MNKLAQLFNSIPLMRFYHFMIFIFFLSSLYAGVIYKIPIVLIALLNVIYHNQKVEKWSVIFYSINFLALAWSNYYILANHFFLLGIFSLFITYRTWLKDYHWNFPFYILTLIIAAATLQKLGSLYFLRGNLMAQFLLNGEGLSLIGHFFDPDYAISSVKFYENYGLMPYNHKVTTFITTDSLAAFAKAFTYIIVVSEILLSLALVFFKPQRKYWALLIFLIATSITRSEFGFFSILIIISMFDANIQKTNIQRYFKYAFPVFIIGFCYTHGLKVIHYFETQF